MRAVLALAFLALARAAVIEVPKNFIKDDFKYIDPIWTSNAFGKYDLKKSLYDDVPTWGKTIINDDFKYIDPMWTSSMFAKYGLTKPLYDDVSTWGKSIGVEDPIVLNHMRSFYDRPALVFFQDPSGRVVSYYAHEGIDKPSSIPEMKSAFYGLHGASDKIAINFHPSHMLGNYKTVLPGHFFEPINSIELRHLMNDMPSTTDHVTFMPNKLNYKDFWNKFDIEDLPMIYKEPVALDINQKYLSEGFVPYTHVVPFTGFSDVSATTPFGYGPRSSIIPGASHLVSGMPFTGFSDVSATTPFGYGPRSGIISGSSHLVSGLPFAGSRSTLGDTPAFKSAAYHLVKADMPYFTAAPASAGFPLVKTAAADSAGFIPVHAFAAAPPATHFVAAPSAATPIFTSAYPFAKAAFPCVNCLGAEHAFAPAGAGVVPLFKTFGDVGLTHFGAADASRSAFMGLPDEAAMTFGATHPFFKSAPVSSSLYTSPSVGLTGLTGSPLVAWNKY